MMIDQADYVELGLACADACTLLNRGLRGKRLDDLGISVRRAIRQLEAWVTSATHALGTSLMLLSFYLTTVL
jgi:hypothetical protein